jgi:8-oxo-dGTP pyrophosphatase MutT (NUDIX family)
MSDQKKPANPLPAATILLVRDATHGIEVFMVKRHHQIDFASGALVFPGGKVDAKDREAAIRAHADGAAALDDLKLSLVACAIREGFEESGILLARKAGRSDHIDAAQAAALSPWRPRLNSGEVGLAEFLAAHDLRLACDALVPFAHWITPTFMPKRFDTFFYVAAAPAGQLGRHDGSESVDSVWIDPAEAVADAKRWTVIFPTKMNLLKLARAKTAAEALARAKSEPIVTVEPKLVARDGAQLLTIPEEAGYGKVEAPVDALRG